MGLLRPFPERSTSQAARAAFRRRSFGALGGPWRPVPEQGAPVVRFDLRPELFPQGLQGGKPLLRLVERGVLRGKQSAGLVVILLLRMKQLPVHLLNLHHLRAVHDLVLFRLPWFLGGRV